MTFSCFVYWCFYWGLQYWNENREACQVSPLLLHHLRERKKERTNHFVFYPTTIDLISSSWLESLTFSSCWGKWHGWSYKMRKTLMKNMSVVCSFYFIYISTNYVMGNYHGFLFFSLDPSWILNGLKYKSPYLKHTL
jgi:hypothetical protein